jgi:hypothetical protein
MSKNHPNVFAHAQALFTEEAIRAGIRNLQMFGGVYPSGLVDEATLQVGS